MKQDAASAGWMRGLEGEPEWETMDLEAAATAAAAADAFLLPDPDLQCCNDPSAAILLPNQVEDIFYPAHEDDIQLMLQGPRDERDLGKRLAGESSSFTMKANMIVQASPDPIVNLLDFIPKEGSRRGVRGARKRLAFPSKPFCSKTTRGKRHCRTKNNAHWTSTEVAKLVKGVSKYGVGNWTKLKRDYFSTSLRTAVHLKDKWRNLLKSSENKVTSKKKEKTEKTMLQPLAMPLIKQIKQLASEHPYPRPKHS